MRSIITCLSLLLVAHPFAGEPEKILGGRYLSWDPVGLAPLDYEKPLTSTEKQMLDLARKGEAGQASTIAWRDILDGKKSFVSVWMLVQCSRVLKRSPNLYTDVQNLDRKKVDPAVFAYLRYETCRLAYTEFMESGKSERVLGNKLDQELRDARKAARKFAEDNLPIATAISHFYGFDAAFGREVIESYHNKHPKGPEVRLLMARVYCSGERHLPIDSKLKRPILYGADFEPKPEKAIAICNELIQENPKNWVAHYYKANAFSKLGKDKDAMREFKLVAAAEDAPDPFRTISKRFLTDPTARAFRIPIVH